MQEKRKKVLICPLDWGLGHATRCIPLIHAFTEAGAEVILAASGKPALLLKKEFPQLKHIDLPGVVIQYGEKKFSFLKMFRQLPSMIFSVWKEHRMVKKIIRENEIDILISDNRYGLWSDECYTVFITHQLHIKLPESLRLLQKSVNSIAAFFIRKFNVCVVPDTSQHLLAGELSSSLNKKLNIIYAGPLSRFKKKMVNPPERKYDILLMLSGPEPQRSLLEKRMVNMLKDKKYAVLLIRGMPDDEPQSDTFIHAVNHLSTEELNQHLLYSTHIICRSGYSSIMDLAAAGRSAIIIPTPGQTEQEYLAALHHQKHHYAMQQNDLSLDDALKKVNALSPLHLETDTGELADNILKKHY
jgi:uncharacterized protein (TIGR00661 family)